ncbi:MAG: tetratricopeptide repeat protein [Armatimonadetes bacterium]|nr:tetratricopeptide repeat protein [Armatimonadota bacterium]
MAPAELTGLPALECRIPLALKDLGRIEEALKAYDRSAECDPEISIAIYNGTAWLNQGRLLDDRGLHFEAIACYERAEPTMEEDPVLWGNKGNSLSALGRHEEALECYAKALALEHHDFPALSGSGYALQSLGRFQEALESFERVLRLDDRHSVEQSRHLPVDGGAVPGRSEKPRALAEARSCSSQHLEQSGGDAVPDGPSQGRARLLRAGAGAGPKAGLGTLRQGAQPVRARGPQFLGMIRLFISG